MKQLVIVCQSAGFLMADIANEALRHYDHVVLLTSGCNGIERPLAADIKIDSIARYDRSSTGKRVLSWLKATIQVFHKLLWHYRNYDVYYFSNPPTSYFCSCLLYNKFRIAIWDLYPDGLMTINISDRSLVSRIWAWFNRKAFNKAECVVTLAQSMKQQISKYCPIEHIIIAPLWSGSSQFMPLDKSKNPFVQENGIEGKFTVLYSGNIGWSHDVDVLVEVANILKNINDIVFLIIGEGKKKDAIAQMVDEYGLTNVKILPFQPVEKLPYSLASADLGVVTLDEKVARVAIPSKTFNLMAVGAPILAIANEDTEMYNLLSLYDNGCCIPKQEIGKIASFICQLKDDRELAIKYKNNSLKAMENHTYKNAEIYFK